jgi:hypothetical protein
MLRKWLTFLLLAASLHSAGAAIDLTPQIKEYTRDGFVYRQVTFKDDEKSISFMPPQGWTISGAKDRVKLVPPEKKYAEAAIQATPLSIPQPFDEATAKVIAQQVVNDAPPGSQSVQLLKQEENPVMIGSYLSFGVLISYNALGQTFQRSVIFVQTPNTQLIFRLSALKADFEPLNQSFRRSLSSWQAL